MAGTKQITPVLRVTRFDRVSSWLIALVIASLAALLWLSAVWATNWLPPKPRPAPLELVELAGGVEDGSVDETLDLQSPEEPSDDPSLAETLSDESEIEEMLENVLEFSDQATNQAQQQLALESQNRGRPGSAVGMGKRALGLGPGDSGLPRSQRWFIRFSDRGTLTEYARQLDHFGIELGVLQPQGNLVLISNVSADSPNVRNIASGKNEQRLYMTWQGGDRRKADLQLFQKAGVDVVGGLMMQFYPQETETQLANLELRYRGRSADQIRRTYFVVRPIDDGYHFVVTRQTYFR